jgi:exopolysaccharide biosynthesis polyprenyl glycosylphosphotransferase
MKSSINHIKASDTVDRAHRLTYHPPVQNRQDTFATVSTLVAIVSDGLAISGGLLAALWIRFNSGWIPIDPTKGVPSYQDMLEASLIATGVFLLTFRSLELFKRPHKGRFEDAIPRMIRAIGLGFILYLALEAALRLEPSFSRGALAIAAGTITFLVLLERYLIYRIEWNLARHMPRINRVLILGTDHLAIKLSDAIRKEPFLRADILGFLRTNPADDIEMEPDQVIGELADFEQIVAERQANEVILCDLDIGHEKMAHLISFCENNLISFLKLPDLFRFLISGVVIQDINGIPLEGTARYPLDETGKRLLKRLVDIGGALLALGVFSPVLLLVAIVVKRSSPGPILYRQTRCGENGQSFTMFKFRTMRADAEKENEAPGWTTPDDPRRTGPGAFLRKWNLDELPQFWNVLVGDMSIVGPRPERPYFVEQFKDDIERYMKRHAFKPGITGWAQVHGLRGDTSIQDRLRYDLFYLKNWSLALDFKIILKTLFSTKNAY